MATFHNSDYRPTFWNGHRQADAIRADNYAGDLPEVRDWEKFATVYYRRFNDGDKPHHATFARFARITGIADTEAFRREVFPHESAQLLDQIGDALLDRALNAIEAAETPHDTNDFKANPLRVGAIWAAAIIEEGGSGDTITAEEFLDEVNRLIGHPDYPALLRLAEAVALI